MTDGVHTISFPRTSRGRAKRRRRSLQAVCSRRFMPWSPSEPPEIPPDSLLAWTFVEFAGRLLAGRRWSDWRPVARGHLATLLSSATMELRLRWCARPARRFRCTEERACKLLLEALSCDAISKGCSARPDRNVSFGKDGDFQVNGKLLLACDWC